jgi:CYTH domain-containing protein
MKAIDRFERFGQKIYNGQDVLKNHILKQYPIHFVDNTEDISPAMQYAGQSDYVWLVNKNIQTLNTFPWHFRPKEKAIHLFPYIYKASQRVKSWKMVQLVPVDYHENIKKITHPHICGIYDFYQNKDQFDIFFSGNTDTGTFDDLVSRFPNAIAVESHEQARHLSTTDMFWMIPDDVEISPIFKFNYQPDDWSHKYVHVFCNGDRYNRDGIALFPKNYQPTNNELKHRFYANKKELNIIASKPRNYDKYSFKNYEEYLHALENSTTELFWNIPDDVKLLDSEKLKFYFNHSNRFDREINHVFLNDTFYDGIVLFSKNSPITKKEFETRFIIKRKEHSNCLSVPRPFDYFDVDNYDDYLFALKNTKTEMFWIGSKNITTNQKLINRFYIPFYERSERTQTHAFVHRINGKNLYNGLFLCSVQNTLTAKEIEYRFPTKRKEHKKLGSIKKSYDIFNIENYSDYRHALDNSKTEMFWAVTHNVDIEKDFDLKLYFTHDNEYDRKENHAFVHRVNGNDYYNGIFLLSKHKTVSKKEIEHRHLISKKEWNTVASGPVQYQRFEIDSYDEYINALQNTSTELFWSISKNIKIDKDFDFNLYFTHDNEYDRKINHAFVHRVNGKDYYDGVFLFSKHKPVTKREIEHRFLVNAKQWNTVASGPIGYNIFEIDSYDQYLNALQNTSTELFWGISKNIKIDKDFKFDLFFYDRDDEYIYERQENHAFVHRVNGKDYYSGVFLFSKHKPVTKREIEHRHLISKKEWNTVASGPVEYDCFEIDSYEDYLYALKHTQTEMFWASSPNIKIDKDFSFDLYFTHDNEYDRKNNHAFIHRVKDQDLRNGLFLLSKHKELTEYEIKHRCIVNAKQWNIVASGPVEYERFKTSDYNDYLYALKNSKTEMFWIIPDYVNITKRFKFDVYFSYNQVFERSINHVYLNGKYHDGVVLCSKHSPISKKEFEYKFIANKKEAPIVISTPKPYDVVFISYQEPNADENYQNLLNRIPTAKRIHGVKGIHQAHIAAAKLCSTDMFWIVDGDAVLVNGFEFDHQVARWDQETVHVWRSINPVNDLVYGYGGVKLFPRELTINMDISKPDMTTSISKKFKAIKSTSNITAFNTDPFNTWKSAFRECVKLSSRIIDRQRDDETMKRLETWCSVGENRSFGKYAILGAVAGKEHGTCNKNNLEMLAKINDFDWLHEQFKLSCPQVE